MSENGAHHRFFDEFERPTYEEWRETAEKSLKGASFDKKLITRTYEEIDLKPLYRQEDSEQIAHTASLPGFPPYVRSTSESGYCTQPWHICQEIPYATPEAFNQALRTDMERGQNSVNMVLDGPTRAGVDANEASASEVGRGGVSISSLDDIATALEGVDLEETPVIIQSGASVLPIASLFFALAKKQTVSLEKLTGCLGMDPLGVLAREGTLPRSLEGAYTSMAQLTAWVATNAPDMQSIAIQGTPYHNGGASATQELGLALATAVTYLRELQSRGVSVDNAARSMRFFFSIGSNFFMEVAKLRAARMLWAKIVNAFGGSEEAQKMIIHARTSSWNKTAYDPYVNMLRTTTEAFSAVTGGANSMHVGCFDEPVRPPDEFSRRIARNTQIILREECHLTKVIDPAGGSWYVEQLTDSVGRKAWEIFQEIERRGGMAAALLEGYPQAQVAQVAEKRAKSIAQRRDIVVGTNMYPNLRHEKPVSADATAYDAVYNERSARLSQYRSSVDQEHCKAALEALSTTSSATPGNPGEVVAASIEAALAGATIGNLTTMLRGTGTPGPVITAVRTHRGAELFETLRKNAETYAARTGSRPAVFLANMGPIPQHKPRADFTTGFFEVGGFEVIGNTGFETVEEAAKAAIDSGAPITVICSTDDTYPELVPPLTKLIKQEKPDAVVILAGYPQDQVEAHKHAGVDEFIHLRANCHEVLDSLQKKIGVVL